MQQYYFRRLLDGVLDTERCRALASVQPHPGVQALQAAVETVVAGHNQPSDTASSDSSDSTSASSETADTPTTSAAKSANQTAQSATATVPAAARFCQPPSQEGDIQHGQGQSSSQRGLSASGPVKQSGANLLDAHGSCKRGRKRNAADMFDECTPDQGCMIHPEPLQVQQPFQRDMWVPGPKSECLLAPHHSVQQATGRQSEDDNAYLLRQGDVAAPTNGILATDKHQWDHGRGMSAAPKQTPLHAEGNTAVADCTDHKQPLHMACMQLLAGAVADRLNRADMHDPSMGK